MLNSTAAVCDRNNMQKRLWCGRDFRALAICHSICSRSHGSSVRSDGETGCQALTAVRRLSEDVLIDGKLVKTTSKASQ